MVLDERIKDAFGKIKADDELKKNTREFLRHKTTTVAVSRRRRAAAIACMMFIFAGWGGYFAYFTEVVAISIDVNPSFELGINRFDRVISVTAYNEDGIRALSDMNIRFLDYREALEQIFADESMAQYLMPDEYIAVTVFGEQEEENDRILTDMASCTAPYGNVHCSSGSYGEVAAAHSTGMSCGKYKAYLELKALEPDITVEEAGGLTMRQIQDRINAITGDTEFDAADEEDAWHHTGHGHGSHYGHGRR